VSEISIEPSSGDDIDNTVAVMGGEDWKMWMDALKAENLTSSGATTVAYSYIGPSTEAVYRKEQLVVLKMIWKLLLSPSLTA
jgi:enoyl-[acyl-carrier protein] reductase/trans-2-enoyl-CoA reductase (NAD+)